MKNFQKKSKLLVTVISIALLAVLIFIYIVVSHAMNQESRQAGRIDQFEHYYSDFEVILQAVEELTDDQNSLYLTVDKDESVLYNKETAVYLDRAETASLRNIQNLFSEKVGFLGSITVSDSQVSFNNINSQYAMVYTYEDTTPQATDGKALTTSQIRPHWYHVWYD